MISNSFFQQYMERFQSAMDGIEVTDTELEIPFEIALERTNALLKKAQSSGNKIMIIGNGGSAGVASHLAVDFWKNGGIRAMTFNDATFLTCVANDYTYDQVFEVPILQFANPGDIAICISSSGNSQNIRKGALAARQKKCHIITCSGFQTDNPLRSMGDLNFYVPSFSYGFVETLHQLIIHAILDSKLYLLDQKNIFFQNQPMDK